ncbi:MAG TPA: hypothetical protein VJ738_02095 [Steroidobacteraceae bacterium]|nr:hypothetical protein [Steroidobacteraceae bacterium]
MIAVFVTFRYGEDFSAPKLYELAESSRAKFEGMPGLGSKLFSVLPESREARNVYVWDRPQWAQRFFTPENLERIAALYGAQPIIEYAQACAMVDNSPLEAGTRTRGARN